MKKTNWYLVLFASIVLSLGFFAYLSVQHLDLKLGLASGPSICNVSEKFNCDTVATSTYSEVFGIPIALLGLFFQLAILCFAVTARFELSEHSATLRRITFWLCLLGAAVSIVMAFISSFLLQAYCLFCIGTYLLSFLSTFVSFKITQDDNVSAKLGEDLKTLFAQTKWAVVVLLLVPGFSYVAHGVMLDSYGFSKMNQEIQYAIHEWKNGPTQNFNNEEGLILYPGSGEPRMTIVEFADFLCPHCKLAATTLENFVKARKDVKLVFKTFPLDGKCNKAISRQGDGLRCALAASVICAEKLSKKGWEAHHWIFENQEKLGSLADWKILEDLSGKANLDLSQMKACVAEEATFETVRNRAQEGANAKIEGTPAIFVNGKMLPRGQFPPFLKAVYETL